MKTHQIKVRPDRLNMPLATCHAGQLSSAVFTIAGDIPDDTDTMTIEVGRTPDTSTTPATPRANLAANATRQADGTWRCYLSPFHFPDLAENLSYHVMTEDTNGNPRWLGTGALVVEKNPANGSPVVPSVVPKDAYAYNTVTGLYHKITATVDEYGQINIAVEEQGVQR